VPRFFRRGAALLWRLFAAEAAYFVRLYGKVYDSILNAIRGIPAIAVARLL
jgi:hypothetical protein